MVVKLQMQINIDSDPIMSNKKEVWQCSYNKLHYVVDVVFNVVIMLHKWGKCWGAKYLGLLESIQGQILNSSGCFFLSIYVSYIPCMLS